MPILRMCVGLTPGTPDHQLMEGAMAFVQLLQPLQCLLVVIFVIAVLLVVAIQDTTVLFHSL